MSNITADKPTNYCNKANNNKQNSVRITTNRLGKLSKPKHSTANTTVIGKIPSVQTGSQAGRCWQSTEEQKFKSFKPK